MNDNGSPQGVIYLLHFTTPYLHAAHYTGWAGRGLPSRLAYHRSGQGSRLIRALIQAGGDFVVARVWEGKTRAFERSLKKRGGARRQCPICRAAERMTKRQAQAVATQMRRAGWKVLGVYSRAHSFPPYRGRRWSVRAVDKVTGQKVGIWSAQDPRIERGAL